MVDFWDNCSENERIGIVIAIIFIILIIAFMLYSFFCPNRGDSCNRSCERSCNNDPKWVDWCSSMIFVVFLLALFLPFCRLIAVLVFFGFIFVLSGFLYLARPEIFCCS